MISFEIVSIALRRIVSLITYLLAGNCVFLFLDCATGSNDCASSRLREVLNEDDASRSSNSEVFTAVASDACRTCPAADGRGCVYLARARRDAQPTSRKDIVLLWYDREAETLWYSGFRTCLLKVDPNYTQLGP